MSNTETRHDFAYPPVVPLDCSELRLIATWAANLSSAPAVFHCDAAEDETERRLTLGDGVATSPEVVLIPARTDAHPAGMWSIAFELPGDSESDGPLCILEAGRYNAAFWSESAVEKFVVPYVAMLGGSRAIERLSEVMAVWNHYPPGMQVFALLHRSAPGAGDSVSFGDLFDVLYLDVERQKVRVASLPQFRSLCVELPLEPGPVLPPPVTLEYRHGELLLDAPQLPSELTLRRMAEYASEFRAVPLYILFDVNRGTYDRHFRLPEELDGQVVIPAFTPRTRTGRPVPARVLLCGTDGQEAELFPGDGDAAFWGNGAVEHMFSPYYVSTYGRVALKELTRITDTWWGEGDDVLLLGGAEVYALVHLPKSDWDAEGPETPILDEVGAFHAGEVRRLSEWIGVQTVR